MTFYERTLTCGLCPTSTTIAAGEWNQQQKQAIEAWGEQHRQKAHAEHEGDLPTNLDPNPMADR